MAERAQIADELLLRALRAALDEGRLAPLLDRLERGSGLPGRPQWGFARLVGSALAAEGGRADPVLRALLAGTPPFPRIVAGFALSTRLSERTRASDVEAFEALCEDERRLVREGAVLALRDLLGGRSEAFAGRLAALASLEDGLLHAAVLVEALGDRAVLDRVPRADEVLGVLERAVERTDRAGRAEERLQGLRELRMRIPPAIAATGARFPDTLAWLEARLAAAKEAAERPKERRAFLRPETRGLYDEAIALLAKGKLGAAEAERLARLGEGSAKPRRDAARVVEGTRKRGGGRRR